MTERYRQTLFGQNVMAAQAMQGSAAYPPIDTVQPPDRLTQVETDFIAARDSFYMATTGADGWPYLQHRGGAVGFTKVLSDRSLAIVDFRGNRQYISVGNLSADPRASLFFMDYVNRARLKLLGRVRVAPLAEAPEVLAAITDPKQHARAERLLIIEVEAFDWNCPQYIEPRFTTADIEPAITRLKSRIADLEAEVAALRG
jgi:uncharacterized protein